MNYDDDERFRRPDFQANTQLPEWLQMGEQESPNISPFVDALKKRMSGTSMSGTADLGGGSTYTPGGTGATRPRIVGGSGAGGGGGMKSL